MRNFSAVIERDPDTGLFVGFVPGFPGAHSQGATLDELNANLRRKSSPCYWRMANPFSNQSLSECKTSRSRVDAGNLPVLKPAEVVTILRKLGFVEVRQRAWIAQAVSR